jgi:hypothetical protein
MKRKASTAKTSAWIWFSRYIRAKDADEDGMTECVTCGAQKHWKELHAGHFIPKKRGLSIYFVEANVHPQCPACNTYNGGMLIEYTRYMQQEYGHPFVDDLLERSRQVVRMRLGDYEAIEQKYKAAFLSLGRDE